jgi:hypothetical protein
VCDPCCQKICNDLQKLTPEKLGVSGSDDPYHFDGPLNRVTIDGATEDYRLVMFFIKKGMTMPLHDHPNMSVFFRLVFGELKYFGYDKVEDKHKFNEFSHDEYEELMATKHSIKAKRTRLMTLKPETMMFVRPSVNNMHTFTATENSMFFDICLPNYTVNSHNRKITYFRDCALH